MTRLSVNINKVATIRNSRGGNVPDVTQAALNCEAFGAQGITVHPRPDERHIRYSDVRAIRPLLTTEFNIEGNPTVTSFVDLVLEVVPDQVTMVPDSHSAITSNAGWNTLEHRGILTDLCKEFKAKGIRTSIFIDPDPAMAYGAAACYIQFPDMLSGSPLHPEHGMIELKIYAFDYCPVHVCLPVVVTEAHQNTLGKRVVVSR